MSLCQHEKSSLFSIVAVFDYDSARSVTAGDARSRRVRAQQPRRRAKIPWFQRALKRVEPNLFRSEIFYQAGVDQHAVEMARLGAVIAAIKQSIAAHEDLLLRGERRIERQAGGLLHDQRQIRTFQSIERR